MDGQDFAKGAALVFIGWVLGLFSQAYFAERHDLRVAAETVDEAKALMAVVTVSNQGNRTEHTIRGIVDLWGVGLQSDLESSEGQPQSVATGLHVTEIDSDVPFANEYGMRLDRLNPGESVTMRFAVTGQLHSIVSDAQSDNDSDAATWRPQE